jgi:hypothetical protein
LRAKGFFGHCQTPLGLDQRRAVLHAPAAGNPSWQCEAVAKAVAGSVKAARPVVAKAAAGSGEGGGSTSKFLNL